MDAERERILSTDAILKWKPNLAAYLNDLDHQHHDALQWLSDYDIGLRQQCGDRDHVVSIYQQSSYKTMRCTLCSEFTKIADDAHPADSGCPMAQVWASLLCKFQISDLKHHFQSGSHRAVLRYITFMRIKSNVVIHEFGGHRRVSNLLQSAVAKLTSERWDEYFERKLESEPDRDHDDLRIFSLRHIDPPFYPFEDVSRGTQSLNTEGDQQRGRSALQSSDLNENRN